MRTVNQSKLKARDMKRNSSVESRDRFKSYRAISALSQHSQSQEEELVQSYHEQREHNRKYSRELLENLRKDIMRTKQLQQQEPPRARSKAELLEQEVLNKGLDLSKMSIEEVIEKTNVSKRLPSKVWKD